MSSEFFLASHTVALEIQHRRLQLSVSPIVGLVATAASWGPSRQMCHEACWSAEVKMSAAARVLKRVADDPHAVSAWGRYQIRIRRRGFRREHYFFCVERAATEALALGADRISVIEFGVAGGNGLLEIERIVAYLETRLPITFEIFGFDSGSGLPAPVDYRDLPYKWQAGDYAMDEVVLRRRLHRSQLVLGEVDATVDSFFERYNAAPLGAAMFDLDYYSSTAAALRILEVPAAVRLPRVHCYFDDLGTIPSLGVPLAIREFNDRHSSSRLEQNFRTIHATDPYARGWKIFEFHDFKHPDYERPLTAGRQLPIARD